MGTTMVTPAAPFLVLLAALGLTLSPRCLAFAPPAVGAKITCNDRKVTDSPTRQVSPLFSTTREGTWAPVQSSLDKLEVVKLALKRPRGASIGVEFAPAANNDLSDGDLAILSMQLRRAKCSAIWTTDAASAAKIAAEQEESRGDFPGPVPVIYCGRELDEAVNGGDGGAGVAAVVVEYGRDVDMESLREVGIIWKVDTADQLHELAGMEKSAGGVFLLSRALLPDGIEEDASELEEMLSNLSKSIVTIAPLSTMLPENEEISLGKHFASLGVSSLLLESACVGDEEDMKYSQFAIEGINKKSSSSFSMTGLTGSTNGHFGVSSHGGNAKWRRIS